ncbi:MAG TPA: 2-oxoacid:acceptor oxidoreductase family protein [Candidatus Hydrogenedens sp.]|nr:2-oxoacid:acceptor oxidoreductase family protein [Candidatus Hydrogenedens sp.]
MEQYKEVSNFFRNYKKDNIIQIRWHGRGGQGAVTSAKILAVAGFISGYKGVTSAPFFGAERRGAPVIATTKLSKDVICDFSQIDSPDIVVILDNTLLKSTNITQGLKSHGWVVLNTPPQFEYDFLQNHFNFIRVNATKIAEEAGLIYAGIPLVNTPMLGTFLHILPNIDFSHIHRALEQFFSPKAVSKNFDVISRVYKECIVEKSESNFQELQKS